MEKKEKLKKLLKNGVFHIFAIDHREVFTCRMKTKNIDDKAVVLKEKLRLINELKDLTSATLVDTFYFFNEKSIIDELDINNVLVGIENNNYNVEAISDDYLTKQISIKELSEQGCNMVKLFVYYHPEMEFTDKIDEIIEDVSNECEKYKLPLMLEPILYQEKPDNYELTLRMLKRLQKYKVDVYKIMFPGNISQLSYEENFKRCEEITKMLNVPWIILSSGITNEEFEKQLEISGKAGASGYAVGRSVWNNFVEEKNLENMREIYENIVEVANKYCKKVE